MENWKEIMQFSQYTTTANWYTQNTPTLTVVETSLVISLASREVTKEVWEKQGNIDGYSLAPTYEHLGRWQM